MIIDLGVLTACLLTQVHSINESHTHVSRPIYMTLYITGTE